MIPVYDSFEWFSSLLPLLIVLVPALLLIRLGGARRGVLIVAGVYLLALVAPRLALFHLAFWVVVAALQPLVSATAERERGVLRGLWVLWASLAITLVPMFAWKLWPESFVVDMNVWTNAVFRSTSNLAEAIDFTAPIVAPIGLSFSSFRAADLLIKSNLGLVDRLSPGRVLAYGVFPPLLVVGPIASYDEVAIALDRPVAVSHERALLGGTQILIGLFKVFVLAFFLGWSGDIFALFAEHAAWQVWVALVAFTWFFYVNFSGYSDMAIGAGRLLGGDLRPNFDSPYTKTTPAGFWNSWHISLTRFLRANVFTAMVGRRAQRQYAATTVTMVLIGLWHSITWASAVFGLYHAISLVGHRIVEKRRPASPNPAWRFLKPIMVFVWFALSLPLLQLGLGDAVAFYGSLVGR
ncbi:MAG: MBOAT family O-acyltransferase [Ilumatobacteraceae bacterium]